MSTPQDGPGRASSTIRLLEILLSILKFHLFHEGAEVGNDISLIDRWEYG